jgi:hypothetical protein
MRVIFQYQSLTAGAVGRVLTLALGRRLSPLAPMRFSHSGEVQVVMYPRAETATVFGRGNGMVTEQFTCDYESDDYFAALIYTRITIQDARGKRGLLTFEGDNGGRISLDGCVLQSASGVAMGIVSRTDFTFVGGAWRAG